MSFNSMSLMDKFEEVFLEEFNKLEYIEIENYVKENNKEILFLCSHDVSFNEKIEEALGKSIIKKVQESYYTKLSRGCNPESLGYSEYLAYALQENSFSSDELRKINLGNDCWRNALIRKYSEKNLLKNLREKLLHPFE